MSERDEKGRFTSSTVSKKSNMKPSRVNFSSAGSTGLHRVGGEIYEEFLRELSGLKGAQTFKEMRENDPVIGAIFFAIEMFMRRVKWFVDPASEEPQALEDAQFLRECMGDMENSWSDSIDEAMSMMEYGWSYHELLYKRRTTKILEGEEEPESKYDDGRIGWKAIEIRGQESFDHWEFEEKTGKLLGLWQRPAPDYELKYVPFAKSLLFRTTVRKNNPEGRSVLRNAYRPWYFKKRMEEIEGVGVERDLAGLPFAEVPAEMMTDDATDSDKEHLKSIVELVKNVRRDEQEGVVWPQSWDENGTPQYNFKLLSSGGQRQLDTDRIITRYETRMAMVVIADFIMAGSDNSNASFAFVTNKSGLFQAALSSWLDVIQEIHNKKSIPRLFRLNQIDREPPKIRHDEVTKPSLADLATFVSALTGAGAQLFPDVDLENHFREIAQLPKREEKKESKTDEEELREQKLQADIAAAKEAIKNPGGIKPEGKDPDSVPGAPTKTTGKVKSKLPPASRRRTKAVDASENVSKRKGLPTEGKCKYCKNPATKTILHSEGMAYIIVCDKHLGKGKTAAENCVPGDGPDPDNINWIHPIGKRDADIDDAKTMVALCIDQKISGIDISDPHVTLAFLGDTTEEEFNDLVSALTENVNARELWGKVGGLGQFPPGPDGVPWWAPVDVVGVNELREQIVEIIDNETDLEVNMDHGYAPHFTIAYKDEGEAGPEPIPSTPVRFQYLDVVRGGESGDRARIPLKKRRVVVRRNK